MENTPQAPINSFMPGKIIKELGYATECPYKYSLIKISKTSLILENEPVIVKNGNKNPYGCS